LLNFVYDENLKNFNYLMHINSVP